MASISFKFRFTFIIIELETNVIREKQEKQGQTLIYLFFARSAL